MGHMNTKILLAFTMAMLNYQMNYCQSTIKSTAKHYVKLYNGEMHEGEKLSYEYPMLQAASFNLDGRKFYSDKVYFFRNSHGTFANLYEIYGERAERYAMRINNTGRIQLYEEIDITAYGGDTLLTDNPKRLASGEVWQFYTKDEGDLKKGIYKNLKNDLTESPASLKYLQTFKRLNTLQISLAVAGAAIIGQQLYARRNEDTVLSPQMVLGGIMCGATFFFEGPKADALWLAVDNYKP
jgi:hypothetical protein